MYRRTLLTIIIITALFIFMTSVDGAKKKKKKGKKKVPHGPYVGLNESTSCDEFSKNARFNPYSVVDQEWFVFYYWAYNMPITTFLFAVPTANYTRALKRNFDGNVTVPVNWTARHILMRGNNDDISLLVERNDRGYYWHYLFLYTKGEKITPRDVRLKQTGDGRLIGLMDCESDQVFAMSRINEVPPKNRLQEEAYRLGYRSRRGKSYLYQGHEWAPVDEDDEDLYWARYPEVNKVETEDMRTQRVISEIKSYRDGLGENPDAAPDPSGFSSMSDINSLRYSATIKPTDTDDDVVDKDKESNSKKQSEDPKKFDTTSFTTKQEFQKPTSTPRREDIPTPKEASKLDNVKINMIVNPGIYTKPGKQYTILTHDEHTKKPLYAQVFKSI